MKKPFLTPLSQYKIVGSKTLLKRVISWVIMGTCALLFTTACASCTRDVKKPFKEAPEFVGQPVDPDIQYIMDEWFELSKRYNLKFEKNVSIGIAPIEGLGDAIGVCSGHNEAGWREITIDKYFWQNRAWNLKVILVYHEMTHCYCTRGHDFGPDQLYPAPSTVGILEMFGYQRDAAHGFLEDGCPMSIMHPTIMSLGCVGKHYSHYVKEMFERCKEYK